MEKITASRLKRLLSSQPYYVWNDSKIIEEDEEDDSFAFELPDEDEIVETSFGEIQKKTIGFVEAKFNKYALEKFMYSKIVDAKSTEDKIKQTNDFLNDESVDVIINPVFGFNYSDEFQVIASPKIFKKSTKEFFLLKLSPSTKKVDILKAWYIYQVLLKLNIEVKNISEFLIATKEYEKGEVDFSLTKYIALSGGGKGKKEAKNELDYFTMEEYRLGNGVDKHGFALEERTLFEMVSSGIIIASRGDDFHFKDFDEYLKQIVEAKNVKDIIYPQYVDTISTWGTNNNWKEVIELAAPEYVGFNGKIISKSSILSKIPVAELAVNSITLRKIITLDKPLLSNTDDIQALINDLRKKVVWYDFEAFALPFCPLKGFLPYQQVVSQVSIIRTMNGSEYSKDNIVIDPLNITLDDQANIIRAIYKEDHLYVVYNQAYENTRLKEIILVLRHFEYEGVEELSDMVDTIINNTIDLADMFTCKAKELPYVLVPQLKAKHSIKLVEKYITKYWPNLPYKIKEYAKLDIPQGMKAMETATNRAVGIIGDQEWLVKVEQLKEYCENDVRAMIMVFVFIEELMKGNHA